MLTYLTSFAAGLMAAFSPCVLPILPIMAASATSKTKWGPLFLATGMIISFVSVAIVFTAFAELIGLKEEQTKVVAASMLVISGLVILIPKARDRFRGVVQRVANVAYSGLSKQGNGVFGQFSVGVLLGAAWGPCVGPTLGIALGLATSSNTVIQAAVMMVLFGVGLILPFLAMAYGLKVMILKSRTMLLSVNRYGNPILGATLFLVGLIMIFGLDKIVEAKAIEVIPEWFLRLSSSL